ncbi:hypothetical protein RFI_07318 [Reticulomyxa filosa]|uniref:Uncharacterized protein n=1 Tax=Reticulomyxa filosa TaxID=46433 RepID=X6NV84_RETFI|nr:hypothetical protein RFI_07318 [Reticulomyxa filosa]|eukprot:ETO29803.1 hypothetical protein RFI_07318 [Reticulomyxa filosa]
MRHIHMNMTESSQDQTQNLKDAENVGPCLEGSKSKITSNICNKNFKSNIQHVEDTTNQHVVDEMNVDESSQPAMIRFDSPPSAFPFLQSSKAQPMNKVMDSTQSPGSERHCRDKNKSMESEDQQLTSKTKVKQCECYHSPRINMLEKHEDTDCLTSLTKHEIHFVNFFQTVSKIAATEEKRKSVSPLAPLVITPHSTSPIQKFCPYFFL